MRRWRRRCQIECGKVAVCSMRGANSAVQREVNRAAVLRLLSQEGPLTRQDLSLRTGLTSGAMTNIIRYLMDDGIVRECPEETITPEGGLGPGRRPIPLELDVSSRLALGVSVSSAGVEIGLYNLGGDLLREADWGAPGIRPEQFVDAVTAYASKVRSEVPFANERLMGACVSVPGIVDTERGVVKASPRIRWESVDLAQMLSSKLNTRCLIENSMRAWTAGEVLFSCGGRDESFIAVYAGDGIGASIVVNGETLPGGKFGAGELGHMVLDMQGPSCSCGSRGCLEAVASIDVFVNGVMEATGLGQTVTNFDEKNDEHRHLFDVAARLVREGNKDALRVADITAKYLATAISNSINLLDPDHVIVTGPLFEIGPITERVRDYAAQMVFRGPGDIVTIRERPTDEHSWTRGAAAALFRKYFYTPASLVCS